MYQNFKKKFFSYEKFSYNFSEFFDDFLKIFFHGLLILLQKFLKKNLHPNAHKLATYQVQYGFEWIMGKIWENTNVF